MAGPIGVGRDTAARHRRAMADDGGGCDWPFGQPHPNTREIDGMQAISVPGGGSAVWTLSAGFTATYGG